MTLQIPHKCNHALILNTGLISGNTYFGGKTAVGGIKKVAVRSKTKILDISGVETQNHIVHLKYHVHKNIQTQTLI